MIKEQQKKVEIGIVKRQDILENLAKIVFLGIGSNLGIRKRNIDFISFTLFPHHFSSVVMGKNGIIQSIW